MKLQWHFRHGWWKDRVAGRYRIRKGISKGFYIVYKNDKEWEFAEGLWVARRIAQMDADREEERSTGNE